MGEMGEMGANKEKQGEIHGGGCLAGCNPEGCSTIVGIVGGGGGLP